MYGDTYCTGVSVTPLKVTDITRALAAEVTRLALRALFVFASVRASVVNETEAKRNILLSLCPFVYHKRLIHNQSLEAGNWK